jgi:hypothetical protein
MTDSETATAGRRLLTLAKLRTYRAYGGDVDGWARRGGGAGMTDEDWQLIERLRQDLFLVASGGASRQFADATDRLLLDITDSEETRNALRELARQHPV